MQKYGHLANQAEGALKDVACLICDDPNPTYSWTDYTGEGYCVRCGTSYQLKWGKLTEDESYPRPNIRKEAVRALRDYYKKTGRLNGCGTYLTFRDYPEQLEGRRFLNEWFQMNREKYPELKIREDYGD